jgi:hypothetical protein
MQLRTLLKPTLFPFLRVRPSAAMQQKRSSLFNSKSQASGRSATAGKGRRLVT